MPSSWIWYLLARRFWGASCTSKSAPRPFLSPMPSSHVPLCRNQFLLGTLLWTYLVLHAFVSLEAISIVQNVSELEVLWRHEPKGEIERPSLLLWFFYFLDSKISRSNLANCSRIAIFRKILFWPHEILHPSKTVASPFARSFSNCCVTTAIGRQAISGSTVPIATLKCLATVFDIHFNLLKRQQLMLIALQILATKNKKKTTD